MRDGMMQNPSTKKGHITPFRIVHSDVSKHAVPTDVTAF